VIGLERGPRLTTTDFQPHDELRIPTTGSASATIKRQPHSLRRPNADARAHTHPGARTIGNAGGGGTVQLRRGVWRMHEDDFRANSQTIDAWSRSDPARLLACDWR